MRDWVVNFDGNPCCFLIISLFDNRHVFDVVFDMDELSQHRKWVFEQGRRAKVDDFHDSLGGAIMRNIEY